MPCSTSRQRHAASGVKNTHTHSAGMKEMGGWGQDFTWRVRVSGIVNRRCCCNGSKAEKLPRTEVPAKRTRRPRVPCSARTAAAAMAEEVVLRRILLPRIQCLVLAVWVNTEPEASTQAWVFVPSFWPLASGPCTVPFHTLYSAEHAPELLQKTGRP